MVLAVGEVLALAVDQALQEAENDISMALEVAVSILTEDPAAEEALNRLGAGADGEGGSIVDAVAPGSEVPDAGDVITFDADLRDGVGDDSDNIDAIIQMGEGIFSRSVDDQAIVAAAGSRPDDPSDLLDAFEASFLPPAPLILYDSDGSPTAQMDPPITVFDELGNPIGERSGDLIALNPDLTPDDDGTVPDVFYQVQGDDLIPVTVIDLMPKIPTGKDGEFWIPPMLTSDDEGNLATTFLVYNELGIPVGVEAIDDDVFTADGDALEAPENPFLILEEGEPVGVEEMIFLLVDDNGEPVQVAIPPPVAFNDEGDIVGFQSPCTIIVGDDGVPHGFEVSGVLDLAFLSEAPVLTPDVAATDEAVLDDMIVRNLDGEVVTQHQLRPTIVLHGDQGVELGRQIVTTRTCVTQDCYDISADNAEELFAETIEVVVGDDTGNLTVFEFQSTTLHNENGDFVGVVAPQAMLVDMESGQITGFVEGETQLFGLDVSQGERQPIALFDQEGMQLGTFEQLGGQEQITGGVIEIDFSFSADVGGEFEPTGGAVHFDEASGEFVEGAPDDFMGLEVTDREDLSLGEVLVELKQELEPELLEELEQQRERTVEEYEREFQEAVLDAGDSDGDGYNDADEVAAGTNPFDPTSYPGGPMSDEGPLPTDEPPALPTEEPPPGDGTPPDGQDPY